MIDHNDFTNDVYFWKQNNLDLGPDIFWKIHHRVSDHHPTAQSLSKILNWHDARYAILINCEGHHAHRNLEFDPKVHTIQPIEIHHARHHFFPWWYDWMQHVEKDLQLHKKLIKEESKITTHVFDALLGTPGMRKSFVLDKIKLERPDNFLWNLGVPWNGTGSSDTFLHGHELPISPDWAKPVYDNKDNRCNHGVLLPWKVYNNTWFSIVLETQSEGHPMITEKTGKCLLGRRLFVNFGNPGVLKLIRSMGYRTFGDIIDESYDNEPDENKRLEMAWEQVQFLLTLDPRQVIDRALPILQHNQKLFLNADHAGRLQHIVKEITNERTIPNLS